jgi:hypothetical protein
LRKASKKREKITRKNRNIEEKNEEPEIQAFPSFFSKGANARQRPF